MLLCGRSLYPNIITILASLCWTIDYPAYDLPIEADTDLPFQHNLVLTLARLAHRYHQSLES